MCRIVFVIVTLLFSQTLTVSVLANDVAFHLVAAKGQNLMQTNATGPLVSPTVDSNYVFTSFVQLTGSGTVTNALLTPPGKSPFALPYDAFSSQFTTNAGFGSKAGLDAVFPNGTYTQKIYAVTDGTKSVPMALNGDLYPNDPVVTNWTAAQTLDMTKGFTLQWTNFVGGTANDYIQLEVQQSDGNAVVRTGNPGQPGSLNGTNTAFSIPAGTFVPGTNYYARLLFAKMTGATNAFPGATGVTAYLKNNIFNINAAPQPNLLFFDGFQQFSEGTSLTTSNYTPIVGSNAFFQVKNGAPTVTASNLLDGVGAFYNCSVVTNQMRYAAIPSRIVTNETVKITWLSWIGATNSGYGGLTAEITTTNSGSNRYGPIVALGDNGVVVIYTNTSASPVPVGSWGGVIGRSMTNTLVIDYAGRTFSYALNGNVLTNMPLQGFFASYLDAFRLTVREDFPGQSLGNRFAIDDIKISIPPPPDVTMYLVLKGMMFWQADGSAPVAVTNMSDLEVDESTSGTVASAFVQLPVGGSRTLYRSPDEIILQTNEFFATTNAMDSTYQNGTYNFIITGVNDGVTTAGVSLISGTFPNAPHVSNWTDAQSIVASNAFTLTWDAFSGGTTNDFIQVTIRNTGSSVFGTPPFGISGALNGTNTSVTIPAYTLTPGVTYDARLTFARGVSMNTTSYPGAVGFAAYFCNTETTIATVNPSADSVGDGIPDWWRALYFGGDGTTTNSQSCATADPDGDGMSNFYEYLAGTIPTNGASALRITTVGREGSDMRVTWTVVTNKTYILQTSTNLVTDSFTNAANQVTILSVPGSPPISLTNAVHYGGATNVPARFYRLRLQTP